MTENNPAGIDDAINNLFFDRYPGDAVRMLEQMKPAEAAGLLKNKPMETALKIWRRFSPQIGAAILRGLDREYQVEVLSQIEPNLGASFLKALDESTRVEILDAVTKKYVRNDLIRAMSYQEDTAGALMDGRVMYFRPDMTVGEVVGILRRRPHGMYRKIYTVDEDSRLHGIIDMEELALAEHGSALSTIERLNPAYVDALASQEELVKTFENQKMIDLPVVDIDKRLIGIIRHHVLVGAALEESSVNMQTMVGVSKDERALSPAAFATRKRLPWLYVNILTAFLAASVVGLFEDTIAQYTALAILMPVVAGQSGNTGAQALAVTLRGLALKEIYPRMWLRIVFKEFQVGLMNGIAVALMAGLGVYLWSQSSGLALVIVLSMIMALTIASVAGALIPVILTAVGQDPAQSSSIFLTTVTDIFGFFSFLGIASLLMHTL